MYVKILVASILLFVAQHIARLLYLMDFNKTVFNHKPGPCRLVEGVEYGSEQIYTSPDGLAFITSGLNFPPHSKKMKDYNARVGVKGRIFLFDFNHPDNPVVDLKITGEKLNLNDFSPHGMDGMVDPATGKLMLFVVNHPSQYESIEKFEFVPDRKGLLHVKTYKSKHMTLVNDVAVTGVDSFYFTKYSHYKSGFWHKVETFLQLAWASVIYYNGKSYEEVADGLMLANGIALSRDKKLVYVASPSSRDIHVYKRENNNYLTLLNVIQLNTLPDNVWVDPETGNLLTGNHPIMYRVLEHLEEPEETAPSQVTVVHLDKTGTSSTGIMELYADDGLSETSVHGSSAANMYKNKLLVGTVRHKLLYCEVLVPLYN